MDQAKSNVEGSWIRVDVPCEDTRDALAGASAVATAMNSGLSGGATGLRIVAWATSWHSYAS